LRGVTRTRPEAREEMDLLDAGEEGFLKDFFERVIGMAK
jgi:hypothetical protein